MNFSIDQILQQRPSPRKHQNTHHKLLARVQQAASRPSYCTYGAPLVGHPTTPRHYPAILPGYPWRWSVYPMRVCSPAKWIGCGLPIPPSQSVGLACTAESTSADDVSSSENSPSEEDVRHPSSDGEVGLYPKDMKRRGPPVCGQREDLRKAGRHARAKKSRTVFTSEQLQDLEKRFSDQKYLSKYDRCKVACTLGLGERQVKTWYQNRRTRWKRECSEKEWSAERELSASSIYAQYVHIKSLQT